MYQAIKFKLTRCWNRLLRALMVPDRRVAASNPHPSYDALSSTLSAIPDLMFELDEEGRHWDARVLREELLVAPTEKLLGHTVSEVMPEEAAKIVMASLDEAKRTGYSHGSHILLPTPLGELWFEISIARKEVSDPKIKEKEGMRFIVLSRDINDRKRAFLEAEKLAYHDSLTELPNRHALHNQLLEKLASQHKQGFHSALLFLDLDNFKQINDHNGHNVGDELLKVVAKRLKANVREDDIIIRWGGDEFIILINMLAPEFHKAKEQVTSICQQIIEKIREPYGLDSGEFECHASIGIKLFNDTSQDINSIIQQADTAMYVAKNSQDQYFAFSDA